MVSRIGMSISLMVFAGAIGVTQGILGHSVFGLVAGAYWFGCATVAILVELAERL